MRAEIVVEEGDGHGQNDEVGNQQNQHEQVPVEPATPHSEHPETEVYFSQDKKRINFYDLIQPYMYGTLITVECTFSFLSSQDVTEP